MKAKERRMVKALQTVGEGSALNYWSRKAVFGSTRAARRAGT